MNQQQLQEARHALWHHDGKPLTTLEDARKWLDGIGICLWLPRGSQFAAPMPSFVEACAGAEGATPPREAIVHATELLARLTESGAAVPLNLLGTNIGVEGERADFIVAASALPYVCALRGAKPWKAAPPTAGAGRVSTLSLRVWEALQTHETMELSELRDLVGHDVSDAGVLRALAELWSTFRVFPIPQAEGKPAQWQLLSRRFAKQANAGSSMGQAAAVSALISLYLDSVIAATTEEIEVALSPLVARSRVGEVVRALEANRQIQFTAVGGALMMHFSDVEEHLPPAIEIVLPPSPVAAESTGPKKYVARSPRPTRGAETPRTFPARERRASTGSEGPRPPYARRGDAGSSRPASSPTGATRKSYGDRSQFKPRSQGSSSDEKRSPFGASRSGPPRERAAFKPRSGEGPPHKSFGGPRGGSTGAARSGPPRERSSFSGSSSRPASGAPKRFGAARPPREGGERKPYSGAERPRSEGGKSFGPRKTFAAKPGGFSKPGGFNKSRGFSKPPGKFGGKPSSKFGAPRPPRTESSERPSREPTERRPWKDRPTGRTSSDRPTGGSGSPRPADRPGSGGRGSGRPASTRAASDRPVGKSFAAKKSSFRKSSDTPFSDRPRAPRSDSSGARLGGFGKRPGGGFKKTSGPSSGPSTSPRSGPRSAPRSKPGGFSKGPGGPKRSGGGFGKKSGGFGKRPGGGKPQS